ncbi:MAG: class I SAM-dependent methyltransferase [Halobacteriaceae archaeon]
MTGGGAPPPDGTGDGDDPEPPRSTSSRTRAAVRRTYDRIADHFAETRHHPWPEVREFLADHAPGTEVGLDVGCGNGRHAGLLAEHADLVVGVDASRELLDAAVERLDERGDGDAFAPVAGDAARVPLRDDAADVGLYVATVHHLPTRDGRLASLDELARVLRPGAPALLSAWSVTADRFDRDAAFDTTLPWTLPDGTAVQRYYHVYDRDDFRAELRDSDLSVVSTRISSGNCYATIRAPDRDEGR